MNPNASAAASKTLPWGRLPGDQARKRQERAEKLNMKEDGVAPVEVKPSAVPQPDGSVNSGAGATGRAK